MLLYLKSQGVNAEQPLGLLIRGPNDRILITRKIRYPSYYGKLYNWKKGLTPDQISAEITRRFGENIRTKLKDLGIETTDVKPIETVRGWKKGIPQEFVVDAEHLYSAYEKKLGKKKRTKIA